MNYSDDYIRYLIGQATCIGFDSLIYNDEIDELINKYYVGNIILFSRNYKDTNQLLELNTKLYNKILNKTGIIPFICIDQEGGNVTRLMNGVTFPASPLSTAKSSYNNATYINARIIAEDMIRLGLNLNLAPCLDINPIDPYRLNIRHLSNDKYEVAKLGKDFIKAMNEFGVLACAKHFPGSGDDLIDTHFGACVQNKGLNELLENELYPFMDNINVNSIMTTHTIFSEVDELPATLSSKVIKNVLRDKMHFDGIIISDALEMDAIDKYFGAVEASKLALNAGIDMILMCHSRDIQIKSFDYLFEEVKKGNILISDLIEKAERIKRYKEYSLTYLNKYFFNKSYIRNKNNDLIINEIVYKSFNFIKGTKPYIDPHTLIISPLAYPINGAEDVFDDRNLPYILANEFNTDYIILENNIDSMNNILNKINDYNHILLFSYNVNINKIQVNTINTILNNHKNVHLISMKGEMDINLYDKLVNYSCLYEYTPNSINSLIRYFKGN